MGYANVFVASISGFQMWYDQRIVPKLSLMATTVLPVGTLDTVTLLLSVSNETSGRINSSPQSAVTEATCGASGAFTPVRSYLLFVR